MANIKISAAADAGTLLGTDMVPMARSGSSTAYHATMAEIQTFTSATASGSMNNVGRNLLHNGLFYIQQRGAGPWTANGNFTADRWGISLALDTVSVSMVGLTDANRAAIGDEAAVWCLYNSFTGNAGAAANNVVFQRLEDARRLSGKTITVSFWASAASGTPKLGVSIDQAMGTGGSPSATVIGNGQSVTLGAPARYSMTFTVPSLSGKTLGTNGDHSTQLNIWYSSGSTNATRAGNVGVQSGAIWLWGMQLEVGSVATPLDKPDPVQQALQCERFYQIGQGTMSGYAAGASQSLYSTTALLVQMRAQPTVVLSPAGGTNYSGVTASTITGGSFVQTATSSAAGQVAWNYSYTASADL